nr:hypothetical protein [Escherichia coli]
MDGVLDYHQFYVFLSAMFMTGHLLNKVVLQPVWLCIWSLPRLGFLLKVRVTEMDKGLVNTLQLGDLPVFPLESFCSSRHSGLLTELMDATG